jgi:LPS-assembly lipoprotein
VSGTLADPTDLRQTAAMTRLPKFQQRLARACVLILMACVLGACGFHLRNALAIPEDLGPLRIVSGNPYSPLASALSLAMDRAGAMPAPPDATTGVATLRIVSERWGNTPLSVDQRGRAQEHTLRYAVVFELTRADDSTLVPEQAIELSRDYISVVTRSAGTEGEREILTEELRKAMVASILRRIDLAFKNPPPVTAPSAEGGQPLPEPSAQPPADASPPAPATP